MISNTVDVAAMCLSVFLLTSSSEAVWGWQPCFFVLEELTSQDPKVLSVCPKGIKSGPVEGPQEGDCSLVKTETTVKTRKRADASAGKSR